MNWGRVISEAEGPKPEAWTAESEGGVIGEGAVTPPHQLGDRVERNSSGSGSGAPAAEKFSCILEAPDGFF